MALVLSRILIRASCRLRARTLASTVAPSASASSPPLSRLAGSASWRASAASRSMGRPILRPIRVPANAIGNALPRIRKKYSHSVLRASASMTATGYPNATCQSSAWYGCPASIFCDTVLSAGSATRRSTRCLVPRTTLQRPDEAKRDSSSTPIRPTAMPSGRPVEANTIG